MLQRRLICLSVFLFVFTSIYAQVNLQTGSATFSLPMFNWQDNKSRLNTLVALSYNSGNGIKVNETGSNVGQGWNLIAGGVITRMQVGEPDDQPAYDPGGLDGPENDIRKYPAGYLYAPVSPDKGCPNALTRYPIYGSTNQLYKQHNHVASDRQLDYFSFQFNGKTGMFVLSTSGAIDHGVVLGDTKMKIEFERDPSFMNALGIRTTIKSFTIRDVDGLIYRFSARGLTKVLEASYCDATATRKLTQPEFKAGKVYHQAGFENNTFIRPKVVGSWYLSEIEDAFTHRKVVFNYDIKPFNNIAGADVSYDSWHDYVIVTHKTSITETPVLTSIVMPDKHKVTFNFGKERADFKGEKVLSSVDVTYDTRYLSKFILNTSYFILNRYGIPVSEFQQKMARLCLRSVKKLGVDLKEDSPPYIFDYYTGSNATDDYVPPPFTVNHDIWGFYNGNASVGFVNGEAIDPTASLSKLGHNQFKGLCFLNSNVSGVYLNPKDGYAKNGLLRQIIYPTGGTITYEYAQNTGVLNSVSRMVGGVHVFKTSSTDGGYSNGCLNAITTQYNYVLSDGSSSSLWGIEMPKNDVSSGMYYSPERRYYTWKWSCPLTGCCDYTWKYPGILSLNQAVSLSDFQRFMVAWAPVFGILTVVTTVMDVVTAICGPTGAFTWVAIIVDVIGSIIQFGITCFGNQTKEGTSIVYYNYDLNAASPLPSQFKRVEVIEGGGTTGKTVQRFTSDDDYPLWIPENTNVNFTARQRFAPWAYGLPRFTTVYDADNTTPVKEMENVYDFYFAQSIIDPTCAHCPPPTTGVYSTLVSCKCLVKKSSSQRNNDWADEDRYKDPDNYEMASIPEMAVEFYGMYSGRTELYQTKERTFKKGSSSQYVEAVTSYQYNTGDPNYEVNSISTTQSNGDNTTKYFVYSGNVSGGVFDVMKQQNMWSVPVGTREYMSKSGGGPSGYVSEKISEFTQLGNGDIKPSRILEERTDRPNSTWTFYSGPNNTDYSKYKITQSFIYDASGNLIGAKDEGDRMVSNIYEYDDRYITASAINADPNVDKPAYSSFESPSFGGWQVSGSTTAHISNSGITGTRAYNLAASTFSATLNTAKPYIVSFWANNSNVAVSGATLKISTPTINGFTYYEYNIAAGASSVSVSGNAYIDELRVYPKTARMRTTTYDPLIGKTSECDENNRITYYEYDKLARLQFVKDENRNIIKMFEYNNVSRQNGCPGAYYNRQIVERFTKSNCGSGYLGGEVPYTVPANKYSSAISQEDADAQAEAELLANGQNQADNAPSNGNCILLYYNTVQSQSFTTQCDIGYTGGSVTYTVPAQAYYSTISQEDANQMALDEIKANGQAYANGPAHAVCNIDNTPSWEWKEGDSTTCSNGHLMMYTTDVNPNSPSFGQHAWKDSGPSSTCPAEECARFKITVPNSISANLYILYTACGTTVLSQKNWNTQIILFDEEGSDAKSAILCLKTVPSWRYGPTGPITDPPGITIQVLDSNCEP